MSLELLIEEAGNGFGTIVDRYLTLPQLNQFRIERDALITKAYLQGIRDAKGCVSQEVLTTNQQIVLSDFARGKNKARK